MNSEQSLSLRKVKSGLMEGILARFYEWRNGPPSDVTGLTYVAESVFANLNHIWPSKPHEKVKSEKYVVEFRGFLEVVEDSSYKFHVVSNGGVKLWIDEKPVIDSWDPSRFQKLITAPLRLNRGFHRLRLLYCNAQRLGEIRVSWERPGNVVEEIPRKRLYFSIGEHVFIMNMPDYYTTALIPADQLVPTKAKKCTSINNICLIELKYSEQPFNCLIAIFNEKEQLVYKTTRPLLIWGGDVYEFQASAR